MPITYRVIERGEPGVTGGGTPKYYAIAASSGRISLVGLSKRISRMSSLSRPDITAVLEALTVIMPELLADGRIIDLGNLGSLRATIKSEASDTAAEVTGANVKQVKAYFRPGKELKNALDNASFKKVD